MREKINDIPKFENVKELLYHSVSKYANNIAFTVKNKVGKEVKYIDYTYTKLLEDINSFGSSLYKLNLENKKVAIVGSNSYEWVIAHLGVLLGGMVSVPLDKGLQLEELENSLIRSEAEAIVFDEKLKDTIEEIKKANKTKIKNFICFTKQDEYLDVHQLIEEGKISSKQSKTIFEHVLTTGKSPKELVKELGMMQITDDKTIRDIVVRVLDLHPDLILDHKKGKNTFDYFVGQVMKETRGQANPGITANIIKEEIEKR